MPNRYKAAFLVSLAVMLACNQGSVTPEVAVPEVEVVEEPEQPSMEEEESAPEAGFAISSGEITKPASGADSSSSIEGCSGSSTTSTSGTATSGVTLS